MRYEVWSEPPPVELENVRFLAGHRRRRSPVVVAADELWDCGPSMTFEPSRDRWRQVVAGRVDDQGAIAAPGAAAGQHVPVRLASGTMTRLLLLAAVVEV
ncbi:hypothetical protein [Rhodococcus wratislaviensis]|uniref:hypothetical protein n=1 Tax=Rhodococcus wratislaviensis TaxID=44752 RepID=UPI001CED1680|nr:hypothetical protein [Rhodococcus wratislaviensis]